MTPNLLLATQTLFLPHRWFKDRKSERPTRKTEHWESPVPGFYEYIPGRGWYLVATDKEAPHAGDSDSQATLGGPVADIHIPKLKDAIRMTQPVAVRYSKVLKHYLLAPDYDMRKRYGRIEDSRGKKIRVGFFRLDDGIAWVNAWDQEGEFIPGPYKLWCIDAKTEQFRHMLRKDASRQNSFERETASSRHSQDSRSTQYRNSGPGTPREGPSVSGSRANSIRGLTPSRPNSVKGLAPSNPTSQPGSQANSRRTSPKRSPSLPLEEAKAKLRLMAQAQALAVRAAASEENVPRGRQPGPALVKTPATPVD